MAMTKAIRERIAACAVHGVTYWADHAERNTFWATTDSQQFVEVQIDRPRKTSYLAHKNGKAYTEVNSLADIAAQLGYVQPEPDVMARPNAAATIEKLKKAVIKHVPTEVLAEAMTRVAINRRPPEVVAAMIIHDPTWLNPFSVEELHAVVGLTAYDEAVMAELNRREEAS